jgi:hypothetical protein
MRSLLVCVLIVAAAAACSRTTAPPLAPPAGARVAVRAWTDVDAEADLRRALARRGLPVDVVDGPMMPVGYDSTRTVTWSDGGAAQTVAGPGTWRFATTAGEYWVCEQGVVQPAV